jgi:membrane-associated PAP2 superfamily phosphatase
MSSRISFAPHAAHPHLPYPRYLRWAAADGFWRSPYCAAHLWWPVLAFAVLTTVFNAMGIDQRLADGLYAAQGHRWALRSAFLTQTLLHSDAQLACRIAWLALLLAWVGAHASPRHLRWRKPLGYLLLCTLLAPALVAAMKQLIHVDCPWDLQRYGGDRPYHALSASRAQALAPGRCFPAGHASAGYAWVALYFFLANVRPRWRGWGLAAGLVLGLVFGVVQQLRGAHFLSHDLWSLMLCWIVALLLARWLLRTRAHWTGVGGERQS